MILPSTPTSLPVVGHIDTGSTNADVPAPVTPYVLLSAPRATFMGRAITLIAVVTPFLGLLAALFWGVTWVDFALLVGFYLITAIGITAGFHRLFTHRSFETYLPIRAALAVLGSMTLQGPVIRWVAWHRRHHQLSDAVDDPHSPHHGGSGFIGWIRGFWHSHLGWLFQGEPNDLNRYVQDLRKNRLAVWVSALFPLWVLIGVVLPGLIGFWVTGTWMGAFRAFLWAGLVRILLVHHVTWSVNSVCHLWGSKPFRSEDESRNNFVFGVLALGEGWHNTHHAFPTSARHGLRWWQIDMSYYFIRALQLVGLAWNVRIPSESALAAARA